MSCRFAFANHILTLLALAEDQPRTSTWIASSVNTNPVVIRRLLGSLRVAGLVVSQPGTGGGWRLLRDPGSISLREVYRAVEGEPLFALHQRAPNRNCPVGRNIQQALTNVFREMEQALEDKLADLTVADVQRSVLSPTLADTQPPQSSEVDRRRPDRSRKEVDV